MEGRTASYKNMTTGQSNKFSIYQLVLMLHYVISSVTDGQKY